MSTRVTSSIASRRARETLIRLLFPKEESSRVSNASSPIASSWRSKNNLDVNDNDRHNHKYRGRTRLSASVSADGAGTTDTKTNNNNENRRHTYSQLRAAYIEKVHLMHPDKVAHQDGCENNDLQSPNSNNTENTAPDSKKEAHQKFIELKNAWEEYESHMRLIKQQHNPHGNNNPNQPSQIDDYWEGEEDNFTMFGVGCSFDDSPQERDLRNEIMEQACRGWFSSGQISHIGRIESSGGEGTNNDTRVRNDTTASSQSTARTQSRIKLSDDDMFVVNRDCANDQNNFDGRGSAHPPKSLVQNFQKIQRRGSRR